MNRESNPVLTARTRLLEEICRKALQARFPSFRGVEVTLRFYPYIALTHTIRRSGKGWAMRISDHCLDAPDRVIEAVAILLACKVLRRKPPQDEAEIYRRYRTASDVMQRVRQRRAERGSKRIGAAEGRTHSLSEIFAEINRRHFNSQVEVRALGWGLRRSWGRLGHYDPAHRTITLSPVLDSPDVPRSVVEYLVYHEMLHCVLEDAGVAGSSDRDHPEAFRRADKAFPGSREARKFLGEFCRKRTRSV